MLLKLTPRADVFAPVLVPRAVYVGPRALVLDVYLQRVSRHELVAVAVVRAHHRQLIQYVPHQRAGAAHVHVADERLSVRGTRLLHAHVRSEADVAERVCTRRVYGIHERLLADLAEHVFVYVVGVVVEVVLAGLVALPARLAHHYVAHALDLETVRLFEARSSTNLHQLLLRRRHHGCSLLVPPSRELTLLLCTSTRFLTFLSRYTKIMQNEVSPLALRLNFISVSARARAGSS